MPSPRDFTEPPFLKLPANSPIFSFIRPVDEAISEEVSRILRADARRSVINSSRSVSALEGLEALGTGFNEALAAAGLGAGFDAAGLGADGLGAAGLGADGLGAGVVAAGAAGLLGPTCDKPSPG
jgi:hypothetical protein